MRLRGPQADGTVAQLAPWDLVEGSQGDILAEASHGRATDAELASARSFVRRLRNAGGKAATEDSGKLYVEVDGPATDALKVSLRGQTLLGLKVETALPDRTDAPALAIRLRAEGTGLAASVSASTGDASGWRPAGKYTVKLNDAKGQARATVAVADDVALGLVGQVFKVKLVSKRSQGKTAYAIRVENESPIVLDGLALSSTAEPAAGKVSSVLGLGLPPRKAMVIGISPKAVERLGLKGGVQVFAADLSAL